MENTTRQRIETLQRSGDSCCRGGAFNKTALTHSAAFKGCIHIIENLRHNQDGEKKTIARIITHTGHALMHTSLKPALIRINSS